MTTKRVDMSGPGFSDDDSPPASNLSSMQRAIVTIQKMRAKIETLERARIEPIAIIGMGCRIPGGANTPEAFFKLLEDGVDTVTEVPPERWHLEPEGPNSEGDARALRWGSFLRGIDHFDASFFGISPREAESLDPQHRLLLEVTWEALERAGQLPERLMGTKAGVFVGIWAPDYQLRVLARDPNDLDAYCFTGTVLSTAAGRLSYTLGLQGPCMSIDTACSSSLTAIHLACQSLRSGESTMAIAGGVNLMLAPTTTKLLSKTQALSPDGRCKTFDARANGYVRGEGCGMLVLKRLSDAERDGDTILALIRGSAVNQDGRSTGLTAPNVLSQQALLRQALESARLAPQDIGYLETHGTGTSLGDPIEVEAIKAVLGAPRERGATCVLGALKSNIGHLEAAAGVAGLIKVVMSMQNDKIPGNLHFRSLNPRIDLNGTSLEIAQTPTAWTPGIRPRYAGVSSFGISGTNAHVIVEEVPRNLEEPLLEEESSTYLLPISAKTPAALRAHAQAYREILVSEHSPRLLDIVHTASARRSHYVHRLSVVGRTKEEMAEQLGAYLQGQMSAGVAEGKSTPARAKVVFVFSGDGSQWLGMGRQLYETDSSFRSVIDTCDNLMTSRLNWSILDELDAPETMSRIGETQVAQPLLFAIQVALVEMLRSWGISPDAMIGHSVGEIAAAHIAGILSLDEAIRLVSIRGRIMQKSTGMGKMVSVSMTPDDAVAMLAGYEERVSIAAINAPDSVVLSGSASALEDVVIRCEKRGFATRRLRVDYAFHSPQMEVFERELVERLVRVDTRRATLAMYSTVLADCVDGKELDVRYWGRNVRQTVDFAGAVFAAIRDGYQLFLEVGPHPELIDNIQRCFAAKNAEGHVVGTLRHAYDDRRALLETAGGLYTRGCAIEWARIMATGGRCVPLPTYTWQRERFWVDLPDQSRLQSGTGHNQTAETTAPPPKVVFVFPGQGSQWLGMGRELLARETAFRTALEACNEAILKEAGFSVLAELQADELTSRLNEIDVVQPVLFAIEVALAELWRSRGIEPDCVVGHSMGEVAAAHIAGMLTLDDAARVICLRSRLLKRISGQGEMALVELPMAEAAAALVGSEASISIAVSNGPRSTVLSGHPSAMERVLAKFEKEGVFCRRVKVDVASHSPQVDPLRDDLLAALHDLIPKRGSLQMRSTVTASPLHGTELNGSYWWNNLRQSVRFSQVMQDLMKEGHYLFVEVSPHPILIPSIEENLREVRVQGAVVASLRRKTDEHKTMLEAFGILHAHGYSDKRDAQHFPQSSTRGAQKQALENDPYADCIFDIAWQKSDLPTGGRGAIHVAGPWLVLADVGGFGAELVERLRVRGETCILATASNSFLRVADDYYLLDPSNIEDLCKILELARGCRGVIHCCALDGATWQTTSNTTLTTDLRRGSWSVLRLTQAILKQGWRDAPRLHVITRAAQKVGPQDGPPAVAQATVWGLGRVISMEQPDLGCIRIDLPHRAGPSDIDWILRELYNGGDEDQIAWRPDGRYVARLIRGDWEKGRKAPQGTSFRADGTYLITGGLGGLGLSLAQWMVEHGVRSLALGGRRPPDELAHAAIAQMRETGANVRAFRVDVSQQSAVAALIADIDGSMLPLRGVVHAAGLLDDRTIPKMTEAEFFHPIGPKVYGAWNLHEATRGRDLDLFVAYSSVAGLLGSPGQANYAAANTFLDALCQARAVEGLPATSIQWGVFADVGMAAALDIRANRMASRGNETFTPTDGHVLFERVIASERSEVALMRFDIRQWVQYYSQVAGAPFLSELARESSAAASNTTTMRFRDTLEQVTQKERIGVIEKHLIEQVARVLRMDPHRIDRHEPFTNIGMDSLMSLELRNRLESSLGLKLSATLIFTYPSIAALAAHIVSEMFPRQVSHPNDDAGIAAEQATTDERNVEGIDESQEPHESTLVGKLAGIRGVSHMTATRGSANLDGRESTPNDTNTLQRAINALEKMKARLDASERMASEPIAIVGMACHFPGGGEGIEAFWSVLDQGIDTIREIPPERWPRSAIRGDRQETRWAALLDNISAFDANFFGISPREAETLDPQQRMLLEVTWEALEDGGQRPDLLFGSRTGVFVGICTSDYRYLVSDRRAEQYDAYCTTGNMLCTAAGRISFTLGFQGPALSIETGCSSSLVAIAQACQSLRARDSDVVVAGGVNALVSATMMAMVAETQALSPDGRCKTLDARANGIVRGEGCGMVVLKRLSDALRDGDRIRGLIRGWAVNQDGRSTGLTTPNVLSQQAMLRQALERARLSPADIDYVELHGTGTSLGDPIEAEALREVFGAPRSDGSTCVLGAVKTNIGHLEGAAGAAGIIKILLALKHERIPKNLHFKRLNPRITLDGTPLVVPIEPLPWLRTKRPRRAGVNSFGISGTNAHVIVEEPPQEERSAPIPSASTYLLPLSAKTPGALTALAKSYAEWFSRETDAPLYDIAYTAGVRRAHHEHRLAIVAGTREEFRTILSSLARDESVVGTSRSKDKRLTNLKVVFVFPGQGAQWLGMGQQLLAEEPVFKVAIEACDAAIRKEAAFSILEELAANEQSSRMSEIDVVQPLLFAIEVGLAALWRSWGIEPDCVIGHSMGEVAAAHVAGALSLADAAAIICRRSRLLRKVSGQGAMAVVELTVTAAESAIVAYKNELSVAVCNGPRSTVIAGNCGALDELLDKLERDGVFCQRIKVDVASHSPQMDAVHGDVVAALSSIRPTGLQVPMRSTTTGKQVRGEELSATYWADNLRQPVLFSQVVTRLIDDEHTIFLEISPHPILLCFIEENLQEKNVDGAVLASLRYGRDERKSLFESFGTLYTNGYGADWRKLYPLHGRVVSLPAYPWQREKFWVETPTQAAERRPAAHRDHPLVGSRVRSSIAAGASIWQAEWSLEDLSYMEDHKIAGHIVVPGAAFIEAALFVSRTQLGGMPILLENFLFLEPLILQSGKIFLVEVTLSPGGNGTWQFRFSSCENIEQPTARDSSGTWTLHATAVIQRSSAQSPSTESLTMLRQKCGDRMSATFTEQLGASYGLQTGPAFQGLRELWCKEQEALGLVSLPEMVKDQSPSYHIHPALLDAALRVLAITPTNDADNGPRVLAKIERLIFLQPGSDTVWSHGLDLQAKSGANAKITLFDETGHTILLLDGLQTQKVARLSTDEDPHADLFIAPEWRSTEPLPIQQKTRGVWLVLSDDDGIGDRIGALLNERGADVTIVKARRPGAHDESGRREVDPGSPDEVTALIAEMLARPRPPEHIVDCWGAGTDVRIELTAEVLEAAQINGCGGALHVVQALLHTGARHMPKLWLITRGTQAIPDAPCNIEITQAPLWGLGRTIAVECPELRCARIDLDPSGGQQQLDLLLNELLSNDEEEEVTFRNGRRFIGRLMKQRLPRKPPAEIPLLPNASYLITGGLGGLGLLAAKAMATAGARHLILVGRHGVSTQAQEDIIAAIKSLGTEVTVALGNVADPDDLARVLRHADEHLPPLRGIVHTAGVLEDGALPGQTLARFQKVLGPKMIGTWNLHVQTLPYQIDFFILYSSLAALLGSPGLGNYVAANSFLDTFAHYRHSRNLAATSINWGLFTDTGMALKGRTAQRIIEHGIAGMTHATKEALFIRVLRERWTQMGIAELDFRIWRERHPQVATLRRFELLQQSLASPTKQRDLSLLATLEKAKASERIQLLENFVRDQLAAILRLDAERIGRHAPLRHLGIDSLMSLELRNRLESALGLKLSATLVWSYPHVAAIAEYLATLLPASVEPIENEVIAASTSTPVREAEASTHEDELLRAFDESMKRARTRRKS